MSKEKTPIEELIERLIDSRNERINKTIIGILTSVIDEAETYLPKEREAIEEAYNRGGFDTTNFCEDSKEYYNDKYGK